MLKVLAVEDLGGGSSDDAIVNAFGWNNFIGKGTRAEPSAKVYANGNDNSEGYLCPDRCAGTFRGVPRGTYKRNPSA